jgi:hypothetical protein
VDKVFKASTCSVTFIEPITAVIEEPTLPATITLVSIGPNSLAKARVSPWPNWVVKPKDAKTLAICKEKTMPVKAEIIKTMGKERTPMNSI